MANNIRNSNLSLRGWTTNATTGKDQGLHPELLKLAADVGAQALSTGAYGPRGPAKSQCTINDVWVGYYPGPWGTSSWQVGPSRVCMSRQELVALLTEGTEPTATSPSARNLKEVKEVKLREEQAAEVQAPLQALKAPAIAAPAIDIGAITVAALAAGKSTDEVLKIIAALKA